MIAMSRWARRILGLLALAVGAGVLTPGLFDAYIRATEILPGPPPVEQPDDTDLDQRPIEQLLEVCKPAADRYYWLGTLCLDEFASRRHDADKVAPRLQEFARSANGRDVARAIAILGWFDQQSAAPMMTAQLESNDWRVVLAASRSLGWLGARGALPALDRVARTHWLTRVRDSAAASAMAIRTSGRLDPPTKLIRGDSPDSFWTYLRFDWFEEPIDCASDTYAWNGKTIEWNPGRSQLYFLDGRMLGSDHGEWGGSLIWRPWLGRASMLGDDNTQGLRRDGDSAIGVFGVAHSVPHFYAAGVSRDQGGRWRLDAPINLPGNVGKPTDASPGVFAVWTDAGVLVFNRDRVLGQATCLR